MIITRTPFRVTLGGGGTDLQSYYSQYGGFIFSASINRYMFLNVNKSIVDDLIRVKYSISETVESLDEISHDIAREALRMMEIDHAIEIISMADIPSGTGLGSSSCYAVGLLNALHTLKRNYISLQDLAEEACRLEIEILKKPIGKQDQYMATFGGFTVLDIDKDGAVHIRSAKVSHTLLDELQNNMLLFFTGFTRQSMEILSEQNSATKRNEQNVVNSLSYIKELGYRILESIEAGNLTNFGLLMHEHWEHKKKLSSKITNPEFNRIYELARANGALGGKISGAGGGGFFVFYSENGHSKLRKALTESGLREMRYRFEFEGTKVLVNFMDNQN
jgi:D-glycero-alpha-D-manno-heptose-7-phosphate kinase